MAEKDPKSPATTSAAYDKMLPRWELMDTVLGGTETMRAAGEAYLPKHQEETDEGYDSRLASTVLLNLTEETLDTLASKPFSEPIKLDEDVPEELEEGILTDVDLQGNNLDVFCRRWFREGVAKAFAHVLVEMPTTEPREDGQPRTLDDDRREGIRPYWVMIKPENLIFGVAQIVGGKEVLVHLRIKECYTEVVGFSEVVKQRIRVLEPGSVAIYVPKPRQTNAQKEEWILESRIETGINYIPLITFYAHRDEFLYGKPPLQDLAHLNVSHWQSSSDQRHILKVARFPILACSGASSDDGSPVTIGPNKVLYNEDPQGKFYYVEHQGNAIEAGRKDLEDLERQMSGYGAEFLDDDPGNPTATAKAIDTAESSSSLSSMALKFEDAVAQALQMTADWMKLGRDGGKVELVKDFTPEEMDVPGLDALDKARERRDLSREAHLAALVRRGILPEDFDAEEDLGLLQDEPMLGGGTEMDLNPGDPGAPTPSPAPTPKKPAVKKPAAKKASK